MTHFYTVFFDIFSVKKVILTLGILVVTLVLQYFCKRLTTGFVRQAVRAAKFETKREEIQQEDTLISIIYTTARVAIWLIALLSTLSIYGISITPLLAGAGVAGVALAFGAQSIVRDFLAGIFILSENQYRVGDVIRVNQDVSGTVETISLRMTTLRDMQGRTHYVPNGKIDIVTNLTMDYGNLQIDLTVVYDTDLDKLQKVIDDVGKKLYEREEFHGVALEPPHMLRLDDFTETGMLVKVIGKCAPGGQWQIRGVLLHDLKKAFDKAGIELARQPLLISKISKSGKK